MFKRNIRPIIISMVATILFTFTLYNIIQHDIPIFKYIESCLFYLLLTLFLHRFTVKNTDLFFIVFLPVLIIDLTVFIEGNSLIPLRFPFATLFPVFGILAGIVILNKKVFISLFAVVIIIAFSLLSHFFFIPSILLYMQEKQRLLFFLFF